MIQNVEVLCEFIKSKNFEPITQRTPYFHMGATLTDAVLQSGLNYRNVVYPRVLKLMTNYSDYKTTCDFLILMQTVPICELISCKNSNKIELIENLSWFFYNKKIENEEQLAIWLNKENNIGELLDIKGVGPKTVDYLKMLSGLQSIAIDRHLFEFLRVAGIIIDSYEEAHEFYKRAAKKLCMNECELDRNIWLYMSSQKV